MTWVFGVINLDTLWWGFPLQIFILYSFLVLWHWLPQCKCLVLWHRLYTCTHTHTHTSACTQWFTHTHHMHTHILIFCQCHTHTSPSDTQKTFIIWLGKKTQTQINQTLSYKMAKAIPTRTQRQTHQKPQSANHWPHPLQHPRKCEESTERCVVPGTLQWSSPSTRTESGAWEEQRWAGGRTQSCPPPCWPPPAWQGGSGRSSATACWPCEGGWAPAAGQRYPRNLRQTNDSQALNLTEIAIRIICIIFMHYISYDMACCTRNFQ